ncbi:MAG: hypothetical protein ORN58_06060, partial [Sediminibacterium sp.]|nr:hypothetical protein [Sediminibacterium sp.]
NGNFISHNSIFNENSLFNGKNPPHTSPFNNCVAKRHFWCSVANATSHLPLKGGLLPLIKKQ